MKLSRRTQLVLLAACTLILAIASTGWWLSSPHGVRKTGQATVMLVGAVAGLSQCRRLPPRTPVMLCTTLLGLAVALFAFWD